VTGWIPVVVSSAGAALAALLGAVIGGVIASRSQRRHWTRDKQVDACAAIVTESTRAELAMRRLWRRDEKVDGKPWNQALALISLVGAPAAIAAAEKMDATFWQSTLRMEELGAFDEASWSEIVQALRSVRLDFINVAREDIVGVRHRLEHLPIILPPVRPSRVGMKRTGTSATQRILSRAYRLFGPSSGNQRK
jgi:hypothetical protein